MFLRSASCQKVARSPLLLEVAALLEPFGEPAYGPHYQAFGGMTVPRRYLNAGLLPVLPAEEHSFACRYQDDVFGSANLLRRGLRVKFTGEDYDTSAAAPRRDAVCCTRWCPRRAVVS